MSQSGRFQRFIVVGVCVAVILSITALITGATLPAANDSIDSAKILTYDAVSPYIKEFLAEQEITSVNGNLAIPDTAAAYVAHQEFTEVLHNNLKAGDGITISADNTITATMFVMTANRLTVSNPDPGKIYVETGVNASSPVAQYIYVGGQNGAPADPTQPDA